MYLILGSSEIFGSCKLNAEFRNLMLYTNPVPFNVPYLVKLSTGKLEPILLSKMNEEPSYNKYYENLLDN